MDERAQIGFRGRVRLLCALMATALLGGSLTAAGLATVTAGGVAAATTPVVVITPATGADAGGQLLAVSGSNVSTTANGGIGIYVAFGPNPSTLPASWSTNPTYFQAVAWTHPGGSGTATNQNLAADGTFGYNLTRADGAPLTAVYTTDAGTFDCTQIECGVITFTAHGVPDRTQDSFTPVSFAPVVTTGTLPATNRTETYAQTLTAVGGTGPYAWSLASGSLPTGLTISAGGVISGSTSAVLPAGTSTFAVAVTDSSSTPVTATKNLSILVKTPSVVVTPTSAANVTSQTYVVSGSGFNATNAGQPGVYLVFGPDPSTLPASPAYFQTTAYYEGAAFTHPGGTGAATNKNLNADGTFSYTFTKSDGSGFAAAYTTGSGSWDCTAVSCGIQTFRSQGSADRSQDTFTPVTFAAALAVSTSTLPATNRTETYSKTLVAEGGVAPYTWSLASGGLPTGLSLSAGGVISGPTTAAASAGTSSFTVQVTDSSASPVSATKALSILVKRPAATITPATGANPSAQSFVVSGSGFNATNAGQAGVYVAFGPNPTTLPASPPFNVNAAYYEAMVWTHPGGPSTATNQNLNADGTFSFTLTQPDGAPLTAVYTTSAGTFDCTQVQCGVLTFRSQGSSDRSQDTFTPISFTVPPTADPAQRAAGTPYNHSVAPFAGVGPYHWSVTAGTLPPGLTLNASTGKVSGTPTTEGSYNATIRVTDSKRPKPVKKNTKLKILVAPVAITIAPSSLPAATVGTAYSKALSASGGVGPYKFKRASGSLPAKLTLTAAGVLKGTPKTAGTSTFVVQVTDKYKFTATRTFTLVVGS